jgi:hypothetical protein
MGHFSTAAAVLLLRGVEQGEDRVLVVLPDKCS